MNSAFKHSQQALNSIQRKVKEKLQQIQFLDKECLNLESQLEQMRDQYLDYLVSLNNEEPNQTFAQGTKLQEIAKLEELLKELSLRKVQISEEIQLIVTQSSEEIENLICETAQDCLGRSNLKQEIRSQHLFQAGLKKQKGRQKNVNPQIKAIIKDFYSEKDSEHTVFEPITRKYCVCKEDSKLLRPECMIECQNSNCKIGWYHFECVGVSNDQIPSHWYCPKCHVSQLKNINKVIYHHEDQIVEVQVKNSLAQQQDFPIQVKRKRGRPRKIPLIQ